MRRKISAAAVVVAAGALATAGSASAHVLIVTPQGGGGGTVQHVGQAPAAGHNSCFGHMTASQNEQSAAVTFLGPPVCPP